MDADDKKSDNAVASRCQLVVFSPDIFSGFVSSVKDTLIKSSTTDNKRTSKKDGHSTLYKTNSPLRKRGRKPANKNKPTAGKKCQNVKEQKRTHSEKSPKKTEEEKSCKENVIIHEGGMNDFSLLKESLSSKTEYADFSKTANQKCTHKSESLESSMLQTSTLLKESVLLSPSFVDSITMNVNQYRTNKEVIRCSDLCESQNPIVHSSEDTKPIMVPVYTSENLDENIRITTEHQLHQVCENSKSDKSVIELSHRTENLKDKRVIVKISEPSVIANTANSDLHIKYTDLTQVDQIICSTPMLNILHVTDIVHEKANNFNIDIEKPNFSQLMQNNNQPLKTKSYYKSEISILSTQIIKPAIPNMHLINSTKSHIPDRKSCEGIIGEISANDRADQTVQADKLKICTNSEIVSRETEEYHKMNIFPDNMSITFKETHDNALSSNLSHVDPILQAEKLKICTNNEIVSRETEEYYKTKIFPDMSITFKETDDNALLSNLSSHDYNYLSPTLDSNLVPQLGTEKSLKLREIHENNDKVCKKSTSECKFEYENENYESSEVTLTSLQSKHFLPDLGNNIHHESRSLTSSNISSQTGEIFLLQEKTGSIQTKETSVLTNMSGEDENDMFYVELSKQLIKTPIQLDPLTLQDNSKSCDTMNIYLKTDETPNDDSKNSSKSCHGAFKTHVSTDSDTVHNESISSLNISNESVLPVQIQDSKNNTGEIYSSSQKVSSVSSYSEELHIRRDESNENNIISTLADYLNKAFRRKTDYLRSKKSLTVTSNDKHSRFMKCTVNDTKDVEETGGNIKNESTRDWNDVITYANRKSSRMMKAEPRHFLSTSPVKLSDYTEQPWFENLNIDCDVTSNNQIIDGPIFNFDSKYSLKSDLENTDYRTIDNQSSERISTPGHETRNQNSISSAYNYSENHMEPEYDITMSIGLIPVNECEKERLNESETIFSAEDNVELFQNILANNSTELLVSSILNEGSLTDEGSHYSEDLIELADLKSNASDVIINTLFSSGEYSFDILDKIPEIDMIRDRQCNIGDSTVSAKLNEVEVQNRYVDCTNKYICTNLHYTTSDESNKFINKEIPVLHEKMCDSENNTQLNGLEYNLENCTKEDIDKTPQSHLKSSQECNTNASKITKKSRGRPAKLKCLDLDTSENTSRYNVIVDSSTSSDTRLQSGNSPSNKGNIKDTDQESDSRMEVNSVINTVQVKTNKKRASKRKSVIEDESNVHRHNINTKSPIAIRSRTRSANITVPISVIDCQCVSTKEDLQHKDIESDTKQYKRKKTNSGQSKTNIIDSLSFESTSRASINFSNSSSSAINMVDMLQCGVCYKQVKKGEWLHHCGKEHNYLAWINGDDPIDFSDNNAVIQHFRKISKPGSPLVCTVCLKTWNSPKRYWDHIRHCTVKSETEHVRSEIVDSILHKEQIKIENNKNAATSAVSCGICDWKGCDDDWWHHLFQEHEYLAWRDSEPPIDFNDERVVREHLKLIVHRLSKLTCRRCGVERKYVKTYMNHSKECLGVELDNSTVVHTDEEQNSLLVEIGSKPAPCNEFTRRILKREIDIETNDNVKCGVCKWEGAECDWLEHIFKEHDYLAWRDGEEHFDVNNAQEVHDHLKSIVQKVSKLKCRRCGVERKYVKLYLSHLKRCEGVHPDTSQVTDQFEDENGLTVSTLEDGSSCMDDSSAQSRNEENIVDVTPTNVKCAVCEWQGVEGLWFDHIFAEHDYLAWRDGELPLDLDDEDAVKEHLKLIMDKLSKLVCRRCGKMLKFVKSYIRHCKRCAGVPGAVIQEAESSSVKDTLEESGAGDEEEDEDDISLMRLKETKKSVKCAICQQLVDEFKWHNHLIGHNYMAWAEGEPQLDEGRQLKAMLVEYKMLTCRLCEAQLSTTGGYQYHMRRCGVKSQRLSGTQVARRYVRKADVVLPTSQHPTSDPVKCAVCFEQMPNEQWKSHLENVHYNLAWFEGGVPFDIMDHHTCYLILQELLKKKRLVCVHCGLSRISAAGFYAHIIICQKSDEEIEAMKVQCPVCERRYLSLAISQHMLTHRNQDTVESSLQSTQDTPDAGGRRRAAVAAKANIEKITSVLVEDKKSCTVCNYVAYTAEELEKHSRWCGGGCFKEYEEVDSGREDKWESESEESDSQVDSELSAEEAGEEAGAGAGVSDEGRESGRDHKSRERKRENTVESSAYKPGLDDSIFDNSFYKEYAEDFCRTHLTSSTLFPQLRCNRYDVISSDVVARYLPPITRSCKIYKQHSQTDTIQWKQLHMFQSQSEMNYGNHTLFVGGPITGISFIPPADRLSCETSEHYMSVTCQRSANAAGLAYDQLHSHPGLVQIWSFGKFGIEAARLVLGIAHDYGTVWALDWCPSGGWEPEMESAEGASELRRIGLMAAACSDGGVYIFAVCDPRQLPESERPIYRTRPVMELQLCSEGLGRPRYQATAVQWSVQKDHSFVSVGYADGTVALYNINTESPLLRTVKDNVILINPYYDSKIGSSTVTGVQVYPSRTHPEEVSVGVYTVKSGKLAPRAGSGAAPVISRRFHTTGVPFVPFLPALHLHLNENIAPGLETSWLQPAATEPRRTCVEAPNSTCIFSRRIAVATPTAQLLLLRNLHPQTDNIKRHMLATFELVPLKDKVKANGKLGQCREPSTYEEAENKYGVLWTQFFKWKDAPHADQYPLSSITAVAFCPCRGHFSRLAWGGLNGIVHLMTI